MTLVDWSAPPARAPQPDESRARAAAVGAALTAASLAAGVVVTLVATLVRLAASGDDGLRFGAAARPPLAAGFGLASAATLLLAARRTTRLRSTTVALAAVLPAASLLSGVPAVAFPLGVTALVLAIARDHRRPGRTRVPGSTAPALAVAALPCLVAGLALATTAAVHPARRPARIVVPRPPAATATATATPRATPSPPVTAAPAEFVAAYYAALDARRFRAAWAVLSPHVRDSFGGFGHWRAGFAATVSSRPERIVVAGRDVRLVLVARDRMPCGISMRRYAVRWRLARRSGGGWSAASLTAVALTPPSGCS